MSTIDSLKALTQKRLQEAQALIEELKDRNI